jgi:hypothetical protein
MKQVMTKVAGIAAVALGVFALGGQVFTPAKVVSKGTVYAGKIYVAGHGGHIAVADVQIDPAGAKPITVAKLDRIEIGTAKSHPFHDVRIDPANRDLMFYSTYKLDAEEGPNKGKLHFGSVDLKGEKVITDVPIALDPRSTWSGANYCASGQSKDYFFPISMAAEGYIDVIEKKTMEQKHRVFLDSLIGKEGYQFMHAINSPDMKTYYVVVNKASGTPKEGWAPTGDLALFLLDIPALEKGELKVLKQATITGGNPGKTVTFRMYYTPDSKYILQSAKDMFYIIDAQTLALVAKENRVVGENHDAFPTADGKFAVLTLRQKGKFEGCDEPIQDGLIQLYDLEKRQFVGDAVSVCYACHQDAGIKKDAILCGLDGNWNN